MPPAGLLMLGIVALGASALRRRAWGPRAALAAAGLLLLCGAGCTAAFSSGPGGRTPAGTYTLVLTGTSEGATRTLDLTLNIKN